MNILFISKLSGNLWAGPNNSVPSQVLAQSRIDNVMWVNLNHVCLPGWRREEYKFINYDDINKCTLNNLPSPFNKPDFIICEEVYCYLPFDNMLNSIMKSGIPYSIVPRSTLTVKAQQQRKIKKTVANLIFYNRFIRKANSLIYLTNFEKEESERRIKHKSWIIPNGTFLPECDTHVFNKDGIRIVYIGRLDIYQKGLDILLEAVIATRDLLRKANVSIELFGPNRDATIEKLSPIIKKNNIEDIVEFKPAVYGTEKDDILNTSDVFIMTSRFEGMPMGLIEALSHGMPCIVTEGTYMMEEIVSFGAGWAAGSTADSVRNSLIKLVSELSDLSQKSHNARILASHYSWSNLAKILHNHIKQVI